MKRFVLACVLCTAMLGVAVCVFMPSGLAQVLRPAAQREDLVEALLKLPAPPPPNPLETIRVRDEKFYDPKNPPPDNAPIEDLIDYWSRQTQRYGGEFFYRIKPSEKVMDRLFEEAQRDPSVIERMVTSLPQDKRTADLVKRLYDLSREKGDEVSTLRDWLRSNSQYFADDLERVASRTRDNANQYVDLNIENDVLSLTRWDWDRAKPILDRLYADNTQPVSRVLATWALYKHALEENSSGDIERYRSELMRLVEDRSQPDGVRDKANDALTHEADFPGRDEWTFSLFEDETLVNMPGYTMLTTLMMYSPPDKYVSKLIELTSSKNKIVRTAAVRCLLVVFGRSNDAEIVRALLPWIENPKWIEREPDDSGRTQLVMYLSGVRMPESVPALIAALDEKAIREIEDYGPDVISANLAANVIRSPSTANANANKASPPKTETYYPLRDQAIRALAMQADPRAVPALRRILATTTDYTMAEVLRALVACGGFSVPEQVDALEHFVRNAPLLAEDNYVQAPVLANSNTSYRPYYQVYSNSNRTLATFDPSTVKLMLGSMVAANPEPGEALVRGTIDRIASLAGKDPEVSRTLRAIIVNWRGLAVSALLLEDLKNGLAERAAVIRLISERKLLREKLFQEVANLQNGTPTAAGISACLTENENSYTGALESKVAETRAAFLACARLIRAELPLERVQRDLVSPDPLLKTAAELYIESEDSPAARSIIHGLHSGEARIVGATMYFKGKDGVDGFPPEMLQLFLSVGVGLAVPPYVYDGGWYLGEIARTETELQKEVKEDADLLGLYSYQQNSIRIYKDRVTLRWINDPSRYYERALTAEEFQLLKDYFADNNVSEMKPFLSCAQGCGLARELLMLGKNGGSRIFVRSETTPPFFAGLEKMLAEFRSRPAAIKYALSKDVPGLEILFAGDDLKAHTVWKQGPDLRVVLSSSSERRKIEDEINKLELSESEEDPETDEGPDVGPGQAPASERMRERRQFEGYSWRGIVSGEPGPVVAQPPGIEYIPIIDDLDVLPDQEQWKARGPGFEIRYDQNGLYKVSGGKITRLLRGGYGSPVLSSNGRWVLTNTFDEDEGNSLIRYDLLTGRSYKVSAEETGGLVPRCFVPSVGKFLVSTGYYESYMDYDDEVDDEPSFGQFYFVDPVNGKLTPAVGEMWPLAAQTFRPLQSTGKPGEYWAARPSGRGHETIVGTYDARTFRFRAVLTLPKIRFGSMEMWADEPGGKVYFVYGGHLLSVPLKK